MPTIVLLAKAPLLKQVKTRLALETSDDLALKVYQEILKKVIQEISTLRNEGNLVLAVSPESKVNSKIWQEYDVNDFTIVSQGEGNLGEKILNNIFKHFKDKGDKVVVIGSDVLGIKKKIVLDLIAGLDEHDLAIAPSPDGGFGAIGTSTRFFNHYPRNPKLLNDVKWSTSSTLKETLHCLRKLNYFLTDEVMDIDDLNDLKKSPLKDLFSPTS